MKKARSVSNLLYYRCTILSGEGAILTVFQKSTHTQHPLK